MSLYSLMNEPYTLNDPLPLLESSTENPFWDMVRRIPGNAIIAKYEHHWEPDWYWESDDGEMHYRDELCRQYAWSIPDPLSLAFVAEHLGTRAVEMGAGTGYYAWQLSQLGVDICCYDWHPPDVSSINHYHSPYRADNSVFLGETRPVFFPVQPGTPEALSAHADRTLFLCWPPMTEMAIECLQHYSGNRLVYVGEQDGGCTGDGAFFAALERAWEEVATHRPVQWFGIHDYITVYERKAGMNEAGA